MKSLSELKETYGKDIADAARYHGIKECILAGLIWQESRGNPNAVSPCGAYGLTQFMPATAKERGYDLSTPRKQIFAGADYLAWIDRHFAHGDTIKMLAGYNAGVGRIRGDKWKQFKETVDYVQKIPQWAEIYRSLKSEDSGGFDKQKEKDII